jgi:micrococcal nuclease
VECFGKEASDRNKELVTRKMVRLEKVVSETDKYGRLLRYVYIDNDFINLRLVAEGYANVVTYPPDLKYSKQFLQAEQEARKSNLGLWNKENGCQN